jgi:DNA-binding transcriptional ArsR family regulator
MHKTAYQGQKLGGIGPDVAQDLQAAARLLRTLGSPVRLAILYELKDAERCVHELVERLSDTGVTASQPLVSQHLRVLRRHDLVRTRRRGREVAYALADEHIGHIMSDAISHVRHQPPPGLV